ncbi:MAG: hypothetical protein KC668_04425 [Myxococcales bacterium]|nr:hypothetical protein [Myxococcales bacterium]
MLARSSQGVARGRARLHTSSLLCAPLFVLLTGCPRGPVPQERAEGPARAADPGLAHAPSGELPPDHPPVNAGQAVAAAEPAEPEGDSAPTPAQAPRPQAPPLAGITWTPPASFVALTPSNSMRAAEYASTDGRVNIAVFHFPEMRETVRANIERWKGQFDEAAQERAQVHTEGVHGLSVTTLDIEGANAGMHAGPSVDTARRPHQRMLAAAVVAPGGFVFFKLVGPADAVATEQAAFRAMIDSLAPTGDAVPGGPR